jgi:hypothetical protein
MQVGSDKSKRHGSLNPTANPDPLFFLNRKEQLLVEALIRKTLESKNLSAWVSNKMGGEYLMIAEELLMMLQGKSDDQM